MKAAKWKGIKFHNAATLRQNTGLLAAKENTSHSYGRLFFERHRIRIMNISEIAKMAGVSPATVSRYLNKGYLSEEKKERIKKVIDETGYMPSQQAQTLRTGRTMLIGVIIPKIDSDSISRIVAGISEVLNASGYQLILANTDNNAEKELEYLEIFKQAKIDGIIHLGTILTPRHYKALKALTIPTVVLGQESDSVSCVYHDDYNAALSLTKYALSKGYKKLAFIGVTPKDTAVGYNRREGFIDALKESGYENELVIYEGSFRMDNGYKNAGDIINNHKDVDGIICATDTIALGAVKYMNENGISIPKDIGVAGMGESKFSSVLSPALTTVHFYYKTCGVEGAKILLEKLSQDNLPNKKIKLTCTVVENSTL